MLNCNCILSYRIYCIPCIILFCNILCCILPDLDEELSSGDKSLDDILPRGNAQTNPSPLRSFGSFTSSSVTRDRNGVSYKNMPLFCSYIEAMQCPPIQFNLYNVEKKSWVKSKFIIYDCYKLIDCIILLKILHWTSKTSFLVYNENISIFSMVPGVS